MDKIFTLPGRESNHWIETNDAETELSEIQVGDEYCIVPIHIYEDSLVEDDRLSEIVIDRDGVVLYPRDELKYIQRVRANSYRACIWHPEVCDNIPTASGILVELFSKEQLKTCLEENIERYPFVRLCTMSPKDINNVPLYDNAKDAFDDLILSERTGNLFSEPYCEGCKGKHLFMRERKEYIWEARCFWSRDKLRAVSLIDKDIEEEENIVEFFKKYGKFFPYHSAVVDIGKTAEGIELIEFNSFGPDMKATAGNFSWYEDVMTLIFSNKPVFR